MPLLSIPVFNIPFSTILQNNGVFAGACLVILATIIAALLFAFNASEMSSYPGFPVVGRVPSERTIWQAQLRWFFSAKDIIFNAISSQKGPFQVIAGSGPLIILPPHYIKDIRSDDRMTFKSWLKKDFFTTYPGFQGFIPAVVNNVFVDSVRIGLTQALNRTVKVLVDETKLCMAEQFPLNNEWQEKRFDEAALRIIGRLSSRTFLPEPICHDEEWLRITVEYTLSFFKGAYTLRAWPAFCRPFVHWFLPATRQLRNDLRSARRLLDPVIKEREKQRELNRKDGKENPADALEWIHQASEKSGEYCDAVFGQLNYTLGAVHTTTITFVNIVYNILANPEYIPLLREEIISMLKEGKGWTKTSLNDLKLMDSVMRESHRLHPSTLMSVSRVADEDVTLPDGTTIPKGAALTLPNTNLVDPEVYEDPLQFNGHRFFNKRQFVTTGDDYFPFGHGKHACPGRFFASNEIKVLLCHMLLQYDWKFPEDQGRPAVKYIGLDRCLDPTARVLFKARTPEMTLE